MPADRDRAILWDIQRAARLVVEFMGVLSRDEFLLDLKTQSAILHQLLVIGEAVKRLSNDLRAQQTSIPWALMAGMRDHLIHGYDAVDLDEVWKTAEEDIPQLLAALNRLLPEGRP